MGVGQGGGHCGEVGGVGGGGVLDDHQRRTRWPALGDLVGKLGQAEAVGLRCGGHA